MTLARATSVILTKELRTEFRSRQLLENPLINAFHLPRDAVGRQ